MKKIAIVSAINSNYGTLLQAYATQQELELLGFKTEILYYTSNPVKQFYRVFNIPFLLTKLKALNIKIITKRKYPNIYEKLKIREKAFLRFREKKLIMTAKVNSQSKLSSLIADCNGVVLGSDQVWNPQNLEMNYYTLNFVPDHIPKIAYAPSFGVSKIPFYQRKKTKKYLSRIEYISVRELAGSKIVKKLIDRDVPVVCDPTALLTKEQWSILKSEKKYTNDKYIFCYFLGSNMNYRRFVKKAAEITSYKIIALQHLDEFVEGDLEFGDITPYDVDPADFINLISNAEIVFSDSFHGTMFSIYYQKKFFTFNYDTQGSRHSVNSRIDSIMKILHIEDRRLNAAEDVKTCLDKEVDWEKIQLRLDEFRKNSLNYLTEALKSV